jgi:alpha-galactosidase
MIEEDVKVDFRWLDAGWYQRPDLGSAEPYVPGKDWWDTVGTWVPDPAKWPGDTLLQSTEYARQNGMKTLMWFEPERISDPNNMVKNFGYDKDWAIIREGVGAVSNNIGIRECLDYTTERICKTLRENKVEMYREDNNSDPAVLWAYLDEKSGENRRGITECKFIQGHYEMWDRIIACTLGFGGCGFVDSCASGGGRNDIESMKRGVPLLRSDFDRTATSIRLSMTSSFCKWIPFCGANTKEKLSQLAPTGNSDPYIWRASYLPALNVDSQFYADPDQDFSVLRNGLNEWKKVNPYLLKEFYVLTPYHKIDDTTGFTAYAYYDPETEKGVLLAFRQENCADTSLMVNLPFADRKYTLTDEDTKEEYETDGSLTLRFDQPRTAKLLWIK